MTAVIRPKSSLLRPPYDARHRGGPSRAKYSRRPHTTRLTEDVMKKFSYLALALVVTGVVIAACGRSIGAGQGQLLSLAQSRNLSPEDAARAIKTFVPP